MTLRGGPKRLRDNLQADEHQNGNAAASGSHSKMCVNQPNVPATPMKWPSPACTQPGRPWLCTPAGRCRACSESRRHTPRPPPTPALRSKDAARVIFIARRCRAFGTIDAADDRGQGKRQHHRQTRPGPAAKHVATRATSTSTMRQQIGTPPGRGPHRGPDGGDDGPGQRPGNAIAEVVDDHAQQHGGQRSRHSARQLVLGHQGDQDHRHRQEANDGHGGNLLSNGTNAISARAIPSAIPTNRPAAPNAGFS